MSFCARLYGCWINVQPEQRHNHTHDSARICHCIAYVVRSPRGIPPALADDFRTWTFEAAYFSNLTEAQINLIVQGTMAYINEQR
jgi:hypothetical protein